MTQLGLQSPLSMIENGDPDVSPSLMMVKHSHYRRWLQVKEWEENREASLISKLMKEVTEGQRYDNGVHDWNNVIHIFSKKRLMQDAEKALKKMRSLWHSPNAQLNFHSMVTGYAAIGGKYTEVMELWGEMKSFASMEKGNMFIDMYKYRTLFFKYHKTLYPKFQTDQPNSKREKQH
ncbi:hypothetical protein LWI28_000180 [Acer negundo]|uniref:Pentatricopeptide repeat-containing protein n=1 Tax=Acer negundo TaxID=4023 RepID=A0AAD5NTD5_ACENE|nr:hypothetical protein LWI28_000180 [Acer negundo]